MDAKLLRQDAETSAKSDMELQLIGPQRPGETGFAARARFHQSWFRYHLLGLPRFGVTTHHSGGRALGCLLALEDAANGYNFLSDAAKELYAERRRQGWGLDPVRTTTNMTSSQALTLNIMGPLRADKRWVTAVLSILLKEDLDTVDQISVEYNPPNKLKLTGDRTIIDGWIVAKTGTTTLSTVIEVKYIDRFNSRYIDVATRKEYRRLADTTGTWDLNTDLAKDRAINQLLRCHGTGVAVSQASQQTKTPKILVLHHPEDPRARKIVHLYRQILRDPDLCIPVSLDALFQLMHRTALCNQQRELASSLTTRYLNYALSEDAWLSYKASQLPPSV
ncbi:hypothetical protein OUY22_00625 [Nonomuraea sp. MCN248]|uniref:PD-(D/E)XK nuclease-like domain-containing protein n=1 Tax=Nonomuraea corallina TaxID=2989783 RepID=A0ABT4S4S1_9ACTN|nr:hypothetical protein [Nonomuraea corallina]MDA0631905.1 hypothetical protein [Nonomuraea corallina]